MSDRRRINGPAGVTSAPVFARPAQPAKSSGPSEQQRVRKPNELRKIFLQTGVISSASGSAYLELEPEPASKRGLRVASPTVKLSCSVQGPKPLARAVSFSPNLQLTASVKFAPFATRNRQGYVRDSAEKDLGMHLENALKGAIIPDRWPKSAIDVAVTVLEGEEDEQGPADRISGVGLFNVLAGCINVAMAALADARVDCLDLLVAGVGALVVPNGQRADSIRVLDPAPAEHGEIVSSCVVGYLPSRDEVVEVWSLGSALPEGAGHGGGAGGGGQGFEQLVDGAIAASLGAQSVLKEVLLESMVRNDSLVSTKKDSGHHQLDDVEMKT